MRFTFENQDYYLEFQRQHKNVKLTRRFKDASGQEHRVVKEVKSRFPYTTARLLQRIVGLEKPALIHEYTVGCVPADKYSHEKGRLEALRGLTDKIVTVGLKKALWDAYNGRIPKKG
jgi:hypothetical protein